ncbi:hypothetical protein EJ08DRAFT_676505 [Tothia fuscella]|uniref:Anaphase-promoting complex subunit 2 n=1 Tax=Tothia fuscella TaxID=1048955 RepID=A0A9P4NYI6_9PEZI|nr:hypothetical protein EJ08DRAFT_676505 [Tothia fuscella]
MAKMDAIFASVFPPAVLDHTTPTPVATPDLGFTAPGQSFGGIISPVGAKQQKPLSAAQIQVKRNISWSTATRFLSLSTFPVVDLNSSALIKGTPHKIKTREIEDAIEFLLSEDSLQGHIDENWDLVAWYLLEVQTHFLDRVAPVFQQLWSSEIPSERGIQFLRSIAQRYATMQSIYQIPVTEHILPATTVSKRRHTLEPGASAERRQQRILSKFERRIHALFIHALPAERFSNIISHVMYDCACKMFQLHTSEGDSPPSQKLGDKSVSEKELMALLQSLQKVGLGGDRAQRAFAHAMDKLMNEFIVSHWMKVDWEGREPVTDKLRKWIRHGFSPFVRAVVRHLGGADEGPNASEVDAQRWLDVAFARLGRARISNLFEYIVRWDDSLGAILDIKEYITTPAARSFLTTNFSHQLSRRLLHPGATTTNILNVYISIIRAFNELDSKGVLLDRVARPIRRYLRDREDTARIIVASLLADIEDSNGHFIDPGPDISVEIAREMLNPITAFEEADQDMDWDNMLWTPDPIDAGPEYKKSKSSDVTASLLSLYNRNEFINSLQTILGEHLLKNEDSRFEKEERLLELFKHRLGDDKLQPCEVMLHDVQQSRRMNTAIHRYQGYRAAVSKSQGAELNAQILSSNFWPKLQEADFTVPAPIKLLQDQYAKGFESIKDMRKLEWLHALGRVTVVLEFEDRKIEEIVPTATASVIYAFQSPPNPSNKDGPIEKSISQLEAELSIEEPLLRTALTYWVSKNVLRTLPSCSNTYTVLETLSSDDAINTSAQQAQALAQASMDAETVSAVKSAEDLFSENEEMYRQFVVGMLTNGGAMNVMRIFMMLKVVVPGGFPFGIEEVRGLLSGMVEGGVVVGTGDVFAVRRE